MTIWITSDTHIGHDRILELGEGRPFPTIEAHDATLAGWLKVKVQPEDYLVHLGDVCMGLREEQLEVFRAIPGKKFLIPGNHDKPSSAFSPRQQEIGKELYSQYFTLLPEIIEIPLDGFRAVFSHYPPADIKDHGRKDRYAQLRPVNNDAVTYFFHGHSHQQHTFTDFKNGSLGVHVGVDSHRYKPVKLKKLAWKAGMDESKISILQKSLKNIFDAA